MTRRERLERKAELRREWADKRRDNATQRFQAAHAATEMIPMGQPILVGHHSEKRHRAAIARSDANMRKGVESSNMASHHESKADGIETQLDRSVFSDDADAIEQLEVRIAEREAERDRWKAYNASCRKGKADLSLLSEDQQADIQSYAKVWNMGPNAHCPGYKLTNLGACIRKDKERIEIIKRRQQRAADAEAAGGVLITVHGDWCNVTFSEKPDRAILTALKAAGFCWGSASWSGYAAKLPDCVKQLAD